MCELYTGEQRQNARVSSWDGGSSPSTITSEEYFPYHNHASTWMQRQHSTSYGFGRLIRNRSRSTTILLEEPMPMVFAAELSSEIISIIKTTVYVRSIYLLYIAD